MAAVGTDTFASPAAGGEIVTGADTGAQFVKSSSYTPLGSGGGTVITTSTARARLQASSFDSGYYVKDSISSADSYVQAHVYLPATKAGASVRLSVRASASDVTRYVAMIDGSGTGACRIYEMVAGTSTQFGSTYTGLLVSAGTDAVYRLEASGSGATVTLTLYENNVSVISATDSTTGRITRAGVAALEFVGQNTADGSSLEIDDYEDGTLPYGGTPPTSNFSTSTSNLTVTLTDSSTAGTNPITSYDTDWGDSTTHMTTASGSHTYASAGTYTITHLVSDGTLTGTHSASVTVSSAPLAGISLSVSGKTVTATDTSVPGSNSITTYYWNWGDGNTSSTANPVHTYAAAGTYLVGHEVVDSIGKYSSTYADAVTQTSSTFSLTTNPGGGVASAAPLDVPDA